MSITARNAALPHHWSWSRMLVALGGSMLVHYLIADRWQSSGGVPQLVAMPPQLQARLETPAAPLAMPAPERPDISPEHPPRAQPVAGTPAPPPALAAPGISPASSAGIAGPDHRFYLARELDRYPVPLAPLNLRAAAGRSGSVRLWLSIDLAGNVVEVTVIDADPSGALAAMAQEYLLAARFVPAVKDERPVKSRILLELAYGL